MTDFRFDFNQFSNNASNNSDAWNNSLVVIDKNIENHNSLAKSIDAVASFAFIERDKKGLEQLFKIVERYTNIKQLHLFSHGNSGILQLGNQTVNVNILNSYQDKIAKVFQKALSSNSDFLIYGCNVAKGEKGLNFINRIHQITGANIAASSSITGSKNSGGNWNLDIRKGSIAINPIDPKQWKSILAIPTIDPGEETTIIYVEGDLGTYILPNSVVTNPNSPNFSGGSLTVSFSANSTTADQLKILDKDDGTGEINNSYSYPVGGSVKYKNTHIGNYTGGIDGTNLVIRFYNIGNFPKNLNATVESVQALVRAITFSNTSDNPSTLPRTVSFSITDGSGRTSATINQIVNVNSINNYPTISDGGGLYFNGIDNYISIPTFTPNNAFTFEAWIKPDGLQSDNAKIFDFDSDKFNTSFKFIENKLVLKQFYYANSSFIEFLTNVTLSNNIWSHVTITLDAVNGKGVCLIVNGIEVYNKRDDYYSIPKYNSTQNFIAKSNLSTDPFFKGSMRDIRLGRGPD